MEDGEVLFGFKAIAEEVTRLTGRKIDEKRAAYWASKQVFRTRRRGHFHTATRSSLLEDFTPEMKAAGD